MAAPMKLVHRIENLGGLSVYSNFDDATNGNRSLERNAIIVPDDPNKQPYLKTTIGYKVVIVYLSRVEAAQMIECSDNYDPLYATSNTFTDFIEPIK